MKKVVLLGDSIRMQYANRVKELLADECEVYFPETNCQYTIHTIWCIRIWMKEMKLDHADLIHYNNGIWDHHRTLDDGKPLSTVEQYVYLNRRLHEQLSKYADKLIWATTIPAGEHYPYDPKSITALPRDEWNREIALYNDVLSAYLSSQGVTINDLYSLIGADVANNICDDGIHLSEQGIELAAQQVAAQIRARLNAD